MSDLVEVEAKVLAGMIKHRHLIEKTPLRLWQPAFHCGVNDIIFRHLIDLDKTFHPKQNMTPARLRKFIKDNCQPPVSDDALKAAFSEILKQKKNVITGDIEPEIENLVDFCLKSKTKQMTDRIGFLIQQNSKGSEAFSELETGMKDISDCFIHHINTKSKKDIVKEMIQETIDLAEGKIKTFNTGLSTVDYKVAIRKSDYVIIGARVSVGKTAYALTCFANMMRDFKGLFFSLEMPIGEIIGRLAQITYNIPISNIRSNIITGNGATKTDFDNYTNSLDSTADNKNLEILGPGYNGISNIESMIKKKVREENIEFVMIDYIQIINHDDKKSFFSRENQLADISKRLRKLTLELNIPIFALAQLNRGKGDKGPELDQLRESGSLEQDASIVMLIDRDMTDFKENTTEAEVFIAKNREGKTGKARVCYIKDLAKFGVVKEAYDDMY